MHTITNCPLLFTIYTAPSLQKIPNQQTSAKKPLLKEHFETMPQGFSNPDDVMWILPWCLRGPRAVKMPQGRQR